jgi:hypothetical protein
VNLAWKILAFEALGRVVFIGEFSGSMGLIRPPMEQMVAYQFPGCP